MKKKEEFKPIVKEEIGVCPVCGSEDLHYEALELDNDSVYYPFTCADCEARGEEWYELTYLYTQTVEN